MPAEESRLRSCRLLALAAFFCHLALNFMRGPGALLEPALPYEDGRDIFAFYYDERDPASVLRSFAGYVSLVPNLIGYLTLALDPLAAARCLRLLPWLLNALALSLFVLPPWRAVIASDRLRCVLSLALAVLPLQDFGMVTMTMYSLWSLLLIQCWLAALPAPRSGPALALSVAVQCVAAWSNPLSLLLLPLYAARALAERTDPRAWIASAVPSLAIASYYLLTVRPDSSALQQGPIQQGLLGLDYVAQRVFFELLGSSAVRMALPYHGLGFAPRWLGLALLVSACGAVVYLWRRGVLRPATRRICVAALYVVPAATLLFVVARDPGQDLFASSFGQRYFFLQKVAVVLAAGCVIADVVRAYALRISLQRLCALAAATLGYLCILNGLDRNLYAGLPQEFGRTRDFLTRLRDAERRGTHDLVRLERGKWSLAVVAR
jgi:hypothetical protein